MNMSAISILIQRFKFSEFSLSSDFFTSTPLKTIFEMFILKHVSCDLIIDSDFQTFH